MQSTTHINIEEISNEFAIAGEYIGGEEINSGHINSTFSALFRRPSGKVSRYIFQRINDNVFKDPFAVMRNVEMVTHHINWKVMRVKRDLGGQTLHLYPARGGRFYATGLHGGIWRCYNFIEGCRTYDIVENTRQAYQAAHAFGSFQDLVSDISPEEIEETIPHFHNTPMRYARLMEVAKQDAMGRLAQAQEELDFIRERQSIVSHLIDLRDAGELPVRITHNDTKINNVMIDTESDEAVCVIDLDTVMPGLSLYDFGDLVRSAVSSAAEDEQDLSKVDVRIPTFEALAQGYLEACDCLIEREIEEMPFSAILMTLEVGMRFLTDYLEGDIYFKTRHERHNLDRARTQLRLVKLLEEKLPHMKSFVGRVARSRMRKKP